MTTSAVPTSPVQRQISLPLSKAVEIAWQNIRLRLSRSILVTSGITLALAFLMAILTGDAIIASMRNHIHHSPDRIEAQKLEAAMKANGVPTTAAEIADDRLQHRWLITL